ncbi:MAG: NAD(P)-dependent alcohol dehydrogenase [Pseudomonadota bacterium]|nr:NAD(P)-dependent alcohol dehydrogenase [Pseudomonadota bacterium]
MKAAVIDTFGLGAEISIRNIPLPKIEANQVLVEIHSASVNPIDWKIMQGQMGQRYGADFPVTLGFDCSGVIVDSGANVEAFKIGDEVFARSNIGAGGCYAEYVALNINTVAYKPKSISFEEAAALPLAALTAINGLNECAKNTDGSRVLIIGASGGVGTLALQIAKILGAAHVTGVCSSKNIELAADLGADEIIDYTTDNPFKTDEGFDIIYDTIGAHSFHSAKTVLKDMGTFLTLVPNEGVDFFIPGQTEWEPNKGYFVAWEPTSKDLQQLSSWVDEGKLKPIIDSIYRLDDVVDAHLKSQTERAVGKIVIRVKD